MFFFLIYGISIGTHSSNLLFMPVFIIYIYLTNYKVFLNVKNASLFLIFFLLGISQFLYILIRVSQIPEYSYISPGFNEWLYLITAKQYVHHLVFSISDIPQRILIYLGHFKANYLVLGPIFGIIGIIELFRKNKKILFLLGLMFILNVSFYLNYYVYDVEMMFIPSFLIFSIFIGTGIFAILEFIKNESTHFKENITFKDMKFDIFSISMIFILLMSFLMPLSFYSANTDDIKQINDDKIVDFTFTALKGIPSNSTIITYWHPYTAFKYYQVVENVNPNVKIIAVDDQNLLNTINQNIDNGKLFIVHDISLIGPYYRVTPVLEFSGSETLYKIERY